MSSVSPEYPDPFSDISDIGPIRALSPDFMYINPLEDIIKIDLTKFVTILDPTIPRGIPAEQPGYDTEVRIVEGDGGLEEAVRNWEIHRNACRPLEDLRAQEGLPPITDDQLRDLRDEQAREYGIRRDV